MKREGPHTISLAQLIQRDSEQDVGCLGLAVGLPRVIGAVLEMDVVEHHVAVDVPHRADRDHPGAPGRGQRAAQSGGQGEVAEVIDGELHLPATSVAHQWGGHDAGVVDQDVQRSRPAPYEGRDRCRLGQVSGAIRTGLFPVLPMMSSAARRPASASRTASVTSAFALAKARAVAIPMPEAPPVTIARRPLRSTPETTSAAVVCAPNAVVARWVPLMVVLPVWSVGPGGRWAVHC